MNGELHISSSPHIHSNCSTRRIMLDVIFSLLPAAAAGIVWFGARALAVIVTCVASTVLAEGVFNLITRREQTIGDLSAAVTGLLLALNLPANVPFWQVVIGAVFAIIIVKCLFGGLGRNLVNPAITARVFMLVAFGALAQGAFPKAVDAASGATPLAELAAGMKAPSLLDLFIGKQGGAIGETCVLALLLGGIYLLVRRVITWHLPVAFIGTVFLCTFLYTGFDWTLTLSWLFSGGLFIGAIFMATDYVTSPALPWGKVIFGVGAGLITVLIRFWGNYPEGVSFGILIMNILDPYIDAWTTPKPFGGKKA